MIGRSPVRWLSTAATAAAVLVVSVALDLAIPTAPPRANGDMSGGQPAPAGGSGSHDNGQAEQFRQDAAGAAANGLNDNGGGANAGQPQSQDQGQDLTGQISALAAAQAQNAYESAEQAQIDQAGQNASATQNALAAGSGDQCQAGLTQAQYRYYSVVRRDGVGGFEERALRKELLSAYTRCCLMNPSGYPWCAAGGASGALAPDPGRVVNPNNPERYPYDPARIPGPASPDNVNGWGAAKGQ